MSRISSAIHTIHHIDALAARDKWINHIHPLAKLLVTMWYIVMVVSFPPYNVTGLLGMLVFLLIIIQFTGISFLQCLKRTKPVLFFIGILSVVNLFFDTTVITSFHSIPITGGFLSMLTVLLKGLFTVLATYILVVTTTIEDICHALRLLHIPKTIIVVLLLIYRYIIVFFKEIERTTIAYSMRAPNHTGIHFKIWGSLIGQLLLKSIDRAQEVYESMQLRGFDGDFRFSHKTKSNKQSVLYTVFCIVLIFMLRNIPVFELIGNLIR
jgi:cobalt/nickel transport system permease protein